MLTEVFSGQTYHKITGTNGAWEVRSPAYGVCNYEDNIQWIWRFRVQFTSAHNLWLPR